MSDRGDGAAKARQGQGALFLAVLGGCLLLGEGEASADETTAKLDLVYEAPPGCPSRAELEEQLRARVPAGWSSGPDSRRFEIRIVREESGYSGRLDVRGRRPDEPSVREIRAPTCRAVSTAIVVFLALALDAETETHEEAPAPSSTVSRTRRPPRKRSPPLAPPSDALWIWSAGIQLSHLRASEPAWGSRVYGEVSRVPAHRAIGFSGRLSWGFSDFTETAPRSGPLNFRLRSARLEGCARIAVGNDVVLSPCAGLDLGTLSGRAPELSGPRYAAPGWTAAAAIVRAGYSPSSWLTIEAELGLLVPFRRTSFELVDPPRLAYTPPSVLFEGGAGVCMSARFY